MNDYLAFGCGVGCIVTTPDRTALLLRRRVNTSYTGTWAMPGGHVNYGESPLDAAVRELKEETGLIGVPGMALPPILTYEKKPMVGIPVTFRSVSGELRSNEKLADLQYFSLYNLPSPLFFATDLVIKEHLIPY